MSKFKVGDKCRCVGLLDGEDQVEVMHTLDSDLATYPDHIRVKFDDGDLGLVPESDLTLINDTPSPIRTVTATEIVAGKYGRIDIESVTGRIIMRIIDPLRFHTAEDLRESGELLLKLAGAIDNGAKVVAK